MKLHVNWNFPRGGGSNQKQNPPREGNGYFCNNTTHYFCLYKLGPLTNFDRVLHFTLDSVFTICTCCVCHFSIRQIYVTAKRSYSLRKITKLSKETVMKKD